jgi:hypothetical protein
MLEVGLPPVNPQLLDGVREVDEERRGGDAVRVSPDQVRAAASTPSGRSALAPVTRRPIDR